MRKFAGKMPPQAPFRASLRNRNAHGHVKYRTRRPGTSVSRKPGNMSQEPFFGEIYKENAVRDDRGHRFMRACAVEMHMDMSQEQFCVEI
jgi:hypothetical protein